MLPNRLDARIAEVIRNRISDERAVTDTTSAAWRTQCEVAEIAMLSEPERRVFLTHIAQRRGDAAALGLAQSATHWRTTAIYSLARRPS